MMPILFPLLSLVGFSAAGEIAAPEMAPLPQLCKTWELDEKACAERIAKAGFVCDRVEEQRLAGLSPAYPALTCSHIGWDAPKEYVESSGCKMHVTHQYIFEVPRNGTKELVLIKTKDEFTKFFAPIESPAEAIGYLMAVTQAYGTKVLPSFRDGEWKVKGARPTTVVDKGDEYTVRMFQQGHCGCYIPFFDEVTFSLKRDGAFTVVSTVRLWEDDPKNEICVD